MVAKKVALMRKDRFVELFVSSMNASEAYQQVHPNASRPVAANMASKYLQDPYVIERLAAERAKLSAKAGVTSERIVEELSHVAFSDIGDIWEPSEQANDLRLKPLAKWPENARRAIASIKTKHYPAKLNKEHEVIEEEYDVFEIKFWGKPETLKVLGQTLGMFQDDPDKPKGPGTVIGTQVFIIGGQRIVV